MKFYIISFAPDPTVSRRGVIRLWKDGSSNSAPGLRWGTSVTVPQTPSFVPHSKFLATPLL